MSYYRHIQDFPDTLIPKFFGVHKLHFSDPEVSKSIGAQKMYFCVMANIIGYDVEVHDMYDLKGSTYKRELSPK